jgi:hypothetical protein
MTRYLAALAVTAVLLAGCGGHPKPTAAAVCAAMHQADSDASAANYDRVKDHATPEAQAAADALFERALHKAVALENECQSLTDLERTARIMAVK